MKVAIVIDSLAIGGAQKHVRLLACGLAARGDNVTVWVLNEIVERLYADPMQAAGVRVEVVGRRAVLNGQGLWRVAWVWRQTRVELVVACLFVSTVFGRMAAQLGGGIPVVTALQARNLDYAEWQRLLVRLTAALSAWTISNSRSALTWASEHEGVRLRRSSYVPNTLDPVGPAGPAASWEALGMPQLDGRLVIGSLGRLHHQKGYDVLLRAVAMLPEAMRSNLAVVVWGEGLERRALESLRAQLRLRDCVFFPGQRADAVTALPKLRLYVQPSRFEGTPNAVMEAATAGVPVVAAAVDGLLDMAGEGWNLDLVPPDETGAALSRALIKALSRQPVRPTDPVARSAGEPSLSTWVDRWVGRFRRSFQLSVV